ncbi:putative GPI-anchored cell surface glycoprotein [Aspergillus stella-maris]|uniref:putative GPI-anchored cell surface glycoprotein n=1 Tax=Aspergillus stella-maris TaxID=1810926 RepID=UPI003CCDDF12
MSLNGLDSPPVIEAYQIALTEAGGWFLLRYVSRDEIALHERGTGGVPDVRNAIESYEESSPLYGFLQYRRRKVVLSYLPEDLSRLVRARTTVQFQSILDKFSPHDTVFSLSKPTDLTESALSSACLLHTASGSITSSSSSLRRRRLMEIAEDAEESPAKDSAETQAPAQDSRQRSFSQVSEATIVPPSVAETVPPALDDDVPTPTSPESQPNALSPTISVGQHSERPASSRNFRDDVSLAPSESRQSTQSARPSLQDLERAAGFKPKVKLGPRPSVDGSGRPRTAGNLARSVEQRPVASLPAGVRASPFRKSNPSLARPRSQGNPVAAPSARVPPVPPLLVPPTSMAITRPQLSPGAKSLSAISTASTSNEKERLMKALQLRKSQMQKRAQEAKRAEAAIEEISNSSQDVNDDKENIGLHSEKLKYDMVRQRLSSISEHDNKAPPTSIQPETQQPVAIETAQTNGQAEATSASAKEEAVVETDNDMSNYTLPSTTYSPEVSESNDLGTNLDSRISPSPETVPSAPCQEDSNGSTEPGISCGAVSPSAILDVPPEDNPEKTPEKEEIIATPPPAEEENLNFNATEIEQKSEPTEIIQPESDNLQKSSKLDSQSDSVTDTPTITASDVDSQIAASSEVVNTEQQNGSTRKERRRPPIKPIQVPTPDYSDDDNLLSDDDFMEELKSATVEEAKPISVGKSPLSPGYSNGVNEQGSPEAWRNSRAVSNPSAPGHHVSNSPPLPIGRSVSSPFSPAENASANVLVAKKINVSSGISKRIKALEQFSSREGAVTPTPSAATPSAASFGALRKRASVSYGGGNPDILSRTLTPEPLSRASSTRRPVSSASTNAENGANSVSVTARIVREPSVTGNDQSMPADPRSLNLQASPLTVEHGTPDETPSRNATPEPSTKTAPRSTSVSDAGSPKPPVAALPRSDSRLSGSSKNDGYFLSRSPSETSASSPEEKKESRTSRLLRRMSSITSPSRRSTFGSKSPVVKEEDSVPAADDGSKTAEELLAAVDIGEVNVQFPDTLLWKRRFVRIDSKGFLVLTPGNLDSSNRNMVKQYHLSEFRTPCIPDEERQELSNSILLDFLDGSTLQCACESRQGQTFVLQTLVDAHRAVSK